MRCIAAGCSPQAVRTVWPVSTAGRWDDAGNSGRMFALRPMDPSRRRALRSPSASSASRPIIPATCQQVLLTRLGDNRRRHAPATSAPAPNARLAATDAVERALSEASAIAARLVFGGAADADGRACCWAGSRRAARCWRAWARDGPGSEDRRAVLCRHATAEARNLSHGRWSDRGDRQHVRCRGSRPQLNDEARGACNRGDR